MAYILYDLHNGVKTEKETVDSIANVHAAVKRLSAKGFRIIVEKDGDRCTAYNKDGMLDGIILGGLWTQWRTKVLGKGQRFGQFVLNFTEFKFPVELNIWEETNPYVAYNKMVGYLIETQQF